MNFNPDYTKPGHEVVFSRKKIETHHPLLKINSVPVKRVIFHKDLELTLESKLDFNGLVNAVLSKVNKMIALLRIFQHILPRHFLLTICKTFIIPHLDYKVFIYDKALNQSFHKKLESIQYNAALAMTGASFLSSYSLRATNDIPLFRVKQVLI